MTVSGKAVFQLPAIVVSRSDIVGLERELDEIKENYTRERLSGKLATSAPSKMLTEIIHVNSYNLDNAHDLEALAASLEYLKTKAPVVTISVASEPSAKFASRLTEWFRSQVHGYALLKIGVSPGVVAGCIVRTSNAVYDLSAGTKLEAGQPILADYLRKAL